VSTVVRHLILTGLIPTCAIKPVATIPPDFDCDNMNNPSPTGTPSPTPAPVDGRDRINVTVAIQLDEYPQEVGWNIYQLGSSVIEIIRIPAGIYLTSSILVMKTVSVLKDELFSFNIFDVVGDGLCCGFGDGRCVIGGVSVNASLVPEKH